MNQLEKFIQTEIQDTKKYFENNEHLEQVSKELEADGFTMRAFDVGYIKAMESILRELTKIK